MKEIKYMYVLGYSAGCYEDRYQNTILCTKDKAEAEKYCTIANEIIDKFMKDITDSAEIQKILDIFENSDYYIHPVSKALNIELSSIITKILDKIFNNYYLPRAIECLFKSRIFQSIRIREHIDFEDYISCFYIEEVEVINNEN